MNRLMNLVEIFCVYSVHCLVCFKWIGFLIWSLEYWAIQAFRARN